MAVYFEFKSEKFFCNLAIEGNSVSVGNLKQKIFKARYPGQKGKGKDFDLIICNAQTNEEYVAEATLIPKCTAVTVRRIPGWPCKPIVVSNPSSSEARKIIPESSVEGKQVVPEISSAKIRVPEFRKYLKRKAPGKSIEFVCNIPPKGYICRRCGVTGHYIQHCPTNGDPEFDIKRWKPPTVNTDDAAFEEQVAGIIEAGGTAYAVPDSAFLPEFLCRLCGHVMKDAVMTGKCCFCSFCDGCIREYVLSKHACVCGAENVLADDLLPNRTLRDVISSVEQEWRRKSPAVAAAGAAAAVNLSRKRCSTSQC